MAKHMLPVFCAIVLFAVRADAETPSEKAETGIKSTAENVDLAEPHVQRFVVQLAQTDVEVLVYAAEDQRIVSTIERVREAALQAMRSIDVDVLGAELQKLRVAAGQPVVLSPRVFDVLAEAQHAARLSSGAFDPTDVPLQALWGFPGPGRVPDSEQIKTALPHVGYQALRLDAAKHTAEIDKDVQLSLSHVRTAYAQDACAAQLVRAGYENFVVRTDGCIIVKGTKGSLPWMLGIQDPRSKGYFAAMPAVDGAWVTTGDYQHAFMQSGVRFHDVIDPRTGVPARHMRSATVFASNAVLATALSRAVFCLGVDAGLDLVARLDGVETLVVDVQNRVSMSAGLMDEVQYRPPTDAP